MRRLFAPLARWLDRRIDARVTEILRERHRRTARGIEPNSRRDRTEDSRRIFVLDGMLVEARLCGLGRLADVIQEEIAWAGPSPAQQAPVPAGYADLVAETTQDIKHISEGERKRRAGSWMGA